ncbi:MAG: hypothetical protein HY998_04460 [candidate division NC10 bacterium]|nr:hypothetical protein [candidate division NC10 bacterium]
MKSPVTQGFSLDLINPKGLSYVSFVSDDTQQASCCATRDTNKISGKAGVIVGSPPEADVSAR